MPDLDGVLRCHDFAHGELHRLQAAGAADVVAARGRPVSVGAPVVVHHHAMVQQPRAQVGSIGQLGLGVDAPAVGVVPDVELHQPVGVALEMPARDGAARPRRAATWASPKR